MTPVRRTAIYGVFTALAIILGYVELQLPAFFAIPGIKPGLTNIVVVVALYTLGDKSALFINFVRILIVSILFGTLMAFMFSAIGGILSTTVMILLKKTDKFSSVGVSAAGGLTHNVGQILVAMFVTGTSSILWYLAVLWITGTASGIIVGIIGGLVCKHVKPIRMMEP
ncbi:MAG: Gx transporter family protein [Butyrivibrio sp.]|nr:Gx transporter family protein [Butyrivibrio sp.]